MTLKSISEQAWQICFPKPGDEAAITREQFFATSKLQYAYQNLLLYWKMKREEGEFTIPSQLLTQVSLDVVDNEIDISGLKVFKAFGDELWLQNIGGLTCECNYVKSNVNRAQLLCDDGSLSDLDRTYLTIGNKVVFPNGTHTTPLLVIYINRGESVNGDVEVEESIGALVLEKLIEMYNKKGVEDVTNNSSSQS